MSSPIPYLTRRAWHYAGPEQPRMLLYLGLFVGAQAILLTEPYVIGQLLNALQTSRGTEELLHAVARGAGLLLAIQLGFWALHGPARVIERDVAFGVRARYRKQLFGWVTGLPLQWHRDNHSGETIDRMGRAAAALFEFTQNSFQTIQMFLRLFGALAILVWYMPAAGIVAVLTTAAAFAIVFAFDWMLYNHYRSLNGFERRISSALHDYVTNMATVITLRLESRVLGETARRIEAALGTFRKNIVLNEVKWFCMSFLIALMTAIVLVWYAHSTLAAGQALLAGTFFTLFEYMRRIGDCFYNFAGIYGTTVRQAADVRGAETIEQAFRGVEANRAAAPLPAKWSSVRIAELDFTYEDEKLRTHHLAGVALELRRRRSLALVGPSGSGKSTLLSLLRGLHRTGRAELWADGVKLPDGLSHLAGCTTLLPQNPEIFADTIRFNITFGVEADEGSVMEAVRLAGFAPVLERLPRGLETDISEKGVNLSGGERQRLALARGIFFSAGSDIVLLDEPTSSCDAHTEKLIYLGLMRLYSDRSLVSVVHKLHLLPLFDDIVVLDDGRVVESGDFYSLVGREGGTLQTLWESYQAREQAMENAQAG